MAQATATSDVEIKSGKELLEGFLTIPERASGIVLFAHGSGSSRHSPRNQFVAKELNNRELGTLLFDLLTPDEHEFDKRTAKLRFDIDLLTERLTGALDWCRQEERVKDLRIGLFGASTGAAAALGTAAQRPDAAGAVVSRGGRPDLAKDALPRVKAPTLMIVGGLDEPVIGMNREAAKQMKAENKIEIVEGATHLFPEAGKLERVSELAGDWFMRHLE